jgi:hydroxyacyl-ACP dehydratase HTD2-like protein with hotdog domain
VIVIYHIDSKRPISRHTNHDQAASALHAMRDQNIISTHNLAIADERELNYQESKYTNPEIKRGRGRPRGSKNVVRRNGW